MSHAKNQVEEMRIVLAVLITIVAMSLSSCASSKNGSGGSEDLVYAANEGYSAPASGSQMELAVASYNEWLYLNFDRALQLASRVQEDPAADQASRVEALKTVCLCNLSNGNEAAARDAIVKMLEIDDSARFTPEGKYPPPVYALYHTVKDEMPGTMDIRTIAIGDFENNSVYTKGFKNYDLDLFRPALTHSIITDLSASTDLKIVDRQRTEKIVEEIQLGGSGIMDAESAVRAGNLLGAHCFVFGQYMVLDKKNVRIDMRVVHTATGEILVAKQITGEFKGKPEKFLALERDLVTEIAGAVDQVINGVPAEKSSYKAAADAHFITKKKEVKGRDGYAESQFAIGQAVQDEERSDYSAALASWKRVLDIDPENKDAKQRVLVLTQLMTS